MCLGFVWVIEGGEQLPPPWMALAWLEELLGCRKQMAQGWWSWGGSDALC